MSLIVRPTQAALLRQLDRFNRLEAFCLIRIGPQFRKTRPHPEGGKRPRWNQPLQFVASRDPLLKVEVWSQQILIGQGHVQLAKVYNTPNVPMAEIIQLWFSGGNAGRIQLVLEFQNGRRPSMSNQNIPVLENNLTNTPGQIPEVCIQSTQNQNIGTLNPIHSAPKNNVEVGKPQPPPGMEDKNRLEERVATTLQQLYGMAMPQIPQDLDPQCADLTSIFQWITGRKITPKPSHHEMSPQPEHLRKAASVSTQKAVIYPQITQTNKPRYNSTKHQSIYPKLQQKVNGKVNKSDWEKQEPSLIKQENQETVVTKLHINAIQSPTKSPEFSAINDKINQFKSQNPYNQKQHQLMTAQSMYPGQNLAVHPNQLLSPTKKAQSQAPTFLTEGDRGIPSMYPAMNQQQQNPNYYPSMPISNQARQNFIQQR